MADEQMDELQEELTIDFDIGYAIKVSTSDKGGVQSENAYIYKFLNFSSYLPPIQDNVIPRAVEWFTGEIAPFPEDDEYYEDEEAEAEYAPPPPPSKRR